MRLELGRSPQGQQLNLSANTLVGAADQLERTLRSRDASPQRQREAVHNLRQAYQPLAAALSQPGLDAPCARRIVERIGMKIGSLEIAMQIPREPEMPVEVRLQRALIREYTGMIAEVDTFMAGLNDKVPEGPQIRTEALALRDATRQLRGSPRRAPPTGESSRS